MRRGIIENLKAKMMRISIFTLSVLLLFFTVSVRAEEEPGVLLRVHAFRSGAGPAV